MMDKLSVFCRLVLSLVILAITIYIFDLINLHTCYYYIEYFLGIASLQNKPLYIRFVLIIVMYVKMQKRTMCDYMG